MSKADEKMKGSGLSIDRAAFILLRVKRAFKKKKQQLQEKKVTGEIKPLPMTKPPPLLRSRTLPSIVVPGLNILQAQIDAKYRAGGQLDRNQKCSDELQPPFFADDTLHGHRSLVFHRLSTPDPGPNVGEAIRNLPSSQFLASAKSYRTSNNSSLSSTALNRLAKLLNQKPNTNLDTPAEEPAVRRLSWEKGERNPPLFYRSSSIDSIVDPTWQSTEQYTQPKRLHSPLLCRTEKLGTMVSPSLGRKRKGSRLVEAATRPLGRDETFTEENRSRENKKVKPGVNMLHRGNISPFKHNKKTKDDNKCRYEGERRPFKKGPPTANHIFDKYHLPTAEGKNRNSISKLERNEVGKEETGNKKKVSFPPEIHLSNKIIEDLTCKYKAELAPLNSRHWKRDNRRGEEVLGRIQRTTEDLKSFEKGKCGALPPAGKKAVTFLDDKLKNGFTNAGFVLSPPSINETDKNESSGGIINDGFVSSPVTDLEEIKKRFVRPKPIISPSEEFLFQLNENFTAPEVENEGICNEAFVQSLDSSGIELTETEERKPSKVKIGKKKRFVNQMRKISSRKSISRENQTKQKRGEGCSDGTTREDKCSVGKKVTSGISNKKLSLSSEDEIYLEGKEDGRKPKKTSRKESLRLAKSQNGIARLNASFESKTEPGVAFTRNWKYSSMSKLPTASHVNDAESIEDFQNISDPFEIVEKGMDFWVDGFKINNKKKLDKINKINIHLHALFSAVENGHVEKARTILESSDVDVNSVNGDNLTPLDVAVLTNHRSLAKMLVAFGAQEGSHLQSSEKLGNHLKNLVIEAERKVQELSGGLLTPEQCLPPNLNNNRASFSIISHHPTSSITCHGGSGDSEKELLIWERRSKGLKKMLLGFEQTRPPDAPFVVTVDVIGTNSVTVRYQGPEHQDSSICTKFKVQWSGNENFDPVVGEKEILDVKCLECTISDLPKGKRHWFRVACGNLKGFGNFKPSIPASVVPSSWRDVQRREPRFSGRLHQLEELFSEIRNLRPETASEIKDFSDQEKQEAPALQRRNQKKKTIKQLFTVAGKFQKNLKRGVYLVCLFYHDDKVLVTNEDFLPAIEVDETYPSSIYNDLHWFMKVACTWNDVKSLKQDMEKNLTSTTSHFRIKLLQAAQQMQSSLCTQDLGQLYYKPIRDAQGTLVFCSVNSFPSLKSISVLNLRWTPISKVQKKIVASEESNVGELLMASIQSQINYHQVSNSKLSKGLYLGYLKMKSSVDLIQIIVPSKSPNVLPHCKIRDNPHVSSEEWEWLKRINSRHKSLENLQGQVKDHRELDALEGTELQQMFVEQVANTARRLFSHMDISLEDAMLHRLYDIEVVDLNSDVSFLIIVPPVETSCSVPGQQDILLERGDLMSISLQVFEMLHLRTYQPEVISRYSRLSCILELDVILAQHSHREAFSPSEVQVAKDRLSKLQELQIQLNTLWKSVRWIMDVITFARDRTGSVSSLSGSLQMHSKATGMANSQGNISKINSVQTNCLSSGCSTQNLAGVSMKHLLALTRKKEGSKKSPNRISKSKCLKENHQYVKCEKRTLLQIPDSPKDPKILKSNVSRGSWPGPGVENSGPLIQDSSFSKSEQHLNVLGGKSSESPHRKYSDCSSDGHYLNSNSSVGSSSYGLKCEGRSLHWGPMTNIGNRMLCSKSEDHLFLSQELRSFKQPKDYKSNRSRSTTATTSVSATNSPLLPQRNICKSNLNREDAGSLLSIANTNVSGSLQSISSDESTAAVVSLPVTTPFRSSLASNNLNSVPHSTSLMSLAKPTVPSSGGKHSKAKIPVTVSLNPLTEIGNLKRTTNPPTSLITGGSILSGNTIPVNINQKPLKTSSNLPDADILNQHISSSLPSFSKHSTGVSSLITTTINPFSSSLPGKQRNSPVKSPIKAVSPIDTVLSGATSVKRSPGVDPFIVPALPPDIDLLQHPGLHLDSHGLSTSGKVSEKNCESAAIPPGFLTSGSVASHEAEVEEDNDDLENGVKVPTPTSGVLQVYAAYETGLAAGTSLKLHVTPRTSAREVVDLVVKQLNMAVLLKGKDGPIYPAEKLKNFCLVAVIGARERCLRDDFKPLQLQNPWKKGRLYVRQKQDVLAALEHSSRQSAFL